MRTISLVCDYVFPDVADATDATFIVTSYLRSLYPPSLQPKIHVVHDGIERPEVEKIRWRADRGSIVKPLQAILVVGSQLDEVPVLGIPPWWLTVTIVGAYPPTRGLGRLRHLSSRFRALAGWRAKARFVRFLLSPRIRCVPWDPVTVYDHLLDADIGIIAFDTPPEPHVRIGAPRWKVKSENRLTLMMSIGLPVVATPIPAYEAVVEQGSNAFLVSNRAEWLAALRKLRDPRLRRGMGERARASVARRFSRDAQANLWESLLRRLGRT